MILKPLSEEYKAETLRLADAKFKRGSLDWLKFIIDRALEDFAAQVADHTFETLCDGDLVACGIFDLLKQHPMSQNGKL